MIEQGRIRGEGGTVVAGLSWARAGEGAWGGREGGAPKAWLGIGCWTKEGAGEGAGLWVAARRKRETEKGERMER